MDKAAKQIKKLLKYCSDNNLPVGVFVMEKETGRSVRTLAGNIDDCVVGLATLIVSICKKYDIDSEDFTSNLVATIKECEKCL